MLVLSVAAIGYLVNGWTGAAVGVLLVAVPLGLNAALAGWRALDRDAWQRRP